MLKCWVFVGKTGPFPMGWVFRVVRPIATVLFRVKPEPEPTRQFGPVANTTHSSGVLGFHNCKAFHLSYVSLLQSQDLLHHDMACII